MMEHNLETTPLRVFPRMPDTPAVSVITPASFANEERYQRGMESLRALGFSPAPAAHAQQHGPLYFAGSPAERIADMHAAFADAESHMLAAVRGGYGSNYLLEGLDLALIRQHPKPFFAYSDLTGLQLYLLDKLGMPAFHGPMVSADFALEDGVHLPSLWAALCGQPYTLGVAEGLRTLKPGEAEGVLYGGCLSIIVSLLGTPWEPATEGKLLFLEDTGVKPYQIDRMVWQLRTAGKLDGVCGLVFGEMLECASPGAPSDLLDRALLSVLDGLNIPVTIGLRSGHVSRSNVTLTLGVQARLEAGDKTMLELLQPAVAQ